MIEEWLMWFSGFGYLFCMSAATAAAMGQAWFGVAICSLIAFIAAVDWRQSALHWLARHD